jgi:gamma-glutamyltranspeptidase/glutathione hydrolase
MLHTSVGSRGIFTAPHQLAAQAGLAVLREGGNAIEAMVAAAAAIAVVYPHMNALGGDGFWLIAAPGDTPIGIDACGAAGAHVEAQLYRRAGHHAIPARGPLAANTVAGTVSGWIAALELSARWGGKLSLERLFDDAIYWAEHGFAPSESQIALTRAKRAELQGVPGFKSAFLPNGGIPDSRIAFCQPRLAKTLRALATDGLDSFYRGSVAKSLAADLQRAGSPLTSQDLAAQRARVVEPLTVSTRHADVYNLPPPTQGLATLIILGLFDALEVTAAETFAYVHALIECTKRAFLIRDAHISDPVHMTVDPRQYLTRGWLAECAAKIDPERALAWPYAGPRGDTIWMGAIDDEGRAVSFIQSIYWEFGSGVVLDDTGILWQNRGSSFTLDRGARNELTPGRKPFHTLNPSLARFHDGRVMAFGTMGGEGQPQTQAALFTRYAHFDMPLQAAITAPRWLLGRTWGAESTTLKVEARIAAKTVDELRGAGHAVEIVGAFDDVMGHAGAVTRWPNGLLEGAADPRGNGTVAAY